MAAVDRCPMCRGPVVWTMAHGERYVACARDCQPCLPGLEPPPLYPFGDEFDPIHWEPAEGEGVMPLEGSAAKESTDDELPF